MKKIFLILFISKFISACGGSLDMPIQATANSEAPIDTSSPLLPASVMTSNQLIPSTLSATAMTMTYNLAGLAPNIPSDAKLLVSIQKFDNFTYLVTNPRVVTSAPLAIKGLSIWVNDIEERPGNTYSLINATVPISSTNSPYKLSTSSLLINIGLGLPTDENGLPTGGPGTDKLSLGFVELSRIVAP